MSPLAPSNERNAIARNDGVQKGLLDDSHSTKIQYTFIELYNIRDKLPLCEQGIPAKTDLNAFKMIATPRYIANASANNMYKLNGISSSLGQIPVNRNYGRLQPRYRHSIDSNFERQWHSNTQQHNKERKMLSHRRSENCMTAERRVLVSRKSDIQIRISLKTDVKLSEAENAWKPAFLQKEKPTTGDTTAELYRQVRSILNKLTAQNFVVLSEQFQSLEIDTTEKLNDVINLVFDKAVNEPSFSSGYAQLCVYLSNRSKEFETERAYFKRVLITKLQVEFEQNVANKDTVEAALIPLKQQLKVFEENGNTAGVNETKAQIAEEESKIRRRLVSTVRFIGELFKLDLLTTKIMNVCIKSLIESCNDEKLECVCKLLKTIGEKLDRTPIESTKVKQEYFNLTMYMNELKAIADRKIPNVNVSTRIKFMIMDVIEMRNNGWNQKTINGPLQRK